MNSRNDVSRRRFLSTLLSSAAVSVVARPVLSFAGFELSAAGVTQLPWKDQGVLNLTNSPYAKLHTVPVRAVTIEKGFWSKRRNINVERSIPAMREQLEQHGYSDNSAGPGAGGEGRRGRGGGGGTGGGAPIPRGFGR